MDKLRKYLSKHLSTARIVESQSTTSTYFYLQSGVSIRVSDHISLTGKSTVSIISTEVPDIFVIYSRNSNKVASMRYEQVKQMIRTFELIPDILGEKKVVEAPVVAPTTPVVPAAPVIDPNTILGLDINLFKPKHKKSITLMVNRRDPRLTGKYKTALLGTTVLGVDSVYFTAGEMSLIHRYVQSVIDRCKAVQEATKKATDTAIQAYAALSSSMWVYGIPFDKFSEHQQELIKNMAEEAKINQQNNPVKNVKGPFILGIDSRYYTSEQRKEICNFMMPLPK